MAVLLPASFKAAFWVYDKKEADREGGTYPCPKQFVDQFPDCDHYLTHYIFLNPKTRDEFVLMLTDRNIYKYLMNGKLVWTRDLRDIHTLEEGVNFHSFNIVFRHPRDPKASKSSSDEYSAYVEVEQCQAEGAMERDLFVITMSRVLRITYQKFFEKFVLTREDVYLMKVNPQGKRQMRCFVGSTARLYNIEVKPLTLELQKTTMFTICIKPKTPRGSSQKARTKFMRERISFLVRSPLERSVVVGDLKRLYKLATSGQPLPEFDGELTDRELSKYGFKK